MATKTERDVVTLALRTIAVGSRGETPDAEDYADALDVYTAFHGRLQDMYSRSVSWAQDEVPAEVWVWVSHLLARELIGVFHVSEDLEARVERLAMKAAMNFKGYQFTRPRKPVEVPLV